MINIKSLTIILLILALWEIIGKSGIIPPYLFPPFSKVAITLINIIATGELVEAYLITLRRVLVGFTLGAVFGILCGVLLSYSKILRDTLYPILSFIAVIPVIALLPLLMVWIGLNELLPIITVFLCSSIPVIFNIMSGVRSINPELIRIARTLGANEIKVVYTVILPLSLPSILSALKIEASMAWKTCFVTEMLALSSGLGYYMLLAESTLRVDILLASLIVLSLSCYIFYLVFERIESSILRKWGFNVR